MVLAPLILVALLGQQPDAVPDLLRQLGADDPAAREEAERRLGEIGEPAEAALKEAIESADPEVRERAGHVLDRIVRLREDGDFAERFRALPTTFGERRCGSLVMKTRIERRSGKDVLVFEDRVGDWCKARCEFSLDPPRMKSFSWTMRDSGEETRVVGDRIDDRLVIWSTEDPPGSHGQVREMPPRLFAAYEYYRLATVVRRAEGVVLSFTQFGIDPEGELLCPSELRCIGRERVGDGNPWRIEYWQHAPGEDFLWRVSTLWVTDDGELIQVQPDNGKALRVEK